MLALLALIPWVLTMGALLFIILRSERQVEEEEEYDLEDAQRITVAVYDDKAYWIYDNTFYESDVTKEPDFATARPIDTMSMNQKELEKLMIILDELKAEMERE